MKYVHRGNLAHMLASKEILNLGWRARVALLLEAASAVAYLHASNVMHRYPSES